MFKLRLSAISRITIGLTGLMVSILCLVVMLGLFPNRQEDIVRSRAEICETAALGFSLLANQSDTAAMQRYLESIAEHHSDIVSMGVRQADGTLLINVADHDTRWDPSRQSLSDQTQVGVPLSANGQLWGTVEACFSPLPEEKIAGGLVSPAVAHGGVMAILCLVVFYFYLRAVLKQLDPSKAVPNRVREALDTLAEGLLVLDQNQRIVLANRAFLDVRFVSSQALMVNLDRAEVLGY